MFKSIFNKVLPDFGFDDFIIIIGLGMIAKGLYSIWHPAMWLGIGTILLLVGLFKK